MLKYAPAMMTVLGVVAHPRLPNAWGPTAPLWCISIFQTLSPSLTRAYIVHTPTTRPPTKPSTPFTLSGKTFASILLKTSLLILIQLFYFTFFYRSFGVTTFSPSFSSSSFIPFFLRILYRADFPFGGLQRSRKVVFTSGPCMRGRTVIRGETVANSSSGIEHQFHLLVARTTFKNGFWIVHDEF